jgi:hypothetical protein
MGAELTREVLVNLIVAVITAAVSVIALRAWERLNEYRNFGHMQVLLGSRQNSPVKIVFPRIAHGPASVGPSNAVNMSLAEGAAIARLITAIRVLRPKGEIRLVESGEFADDGKPFVSVGGPTHNRVTRDFGFILSGETERGTPFIVIFGITPFGSNIAARAYVDIKQLTHDHRLLRRRGHRALFVVPGDVEGYGLAGYSISNIHLEGVRDLSGPG